MIATIEMTAKAVKILTITMIYYSLITLSLFFCAPLLVTPKMIIEGAWLIFFDYDYDYDGEQFNHSRFTIHYWIFLRCHLYFLQVKIPTVLVSISGNLQFSDILFTCT